MSFKKNKYQVLENAISFELANFCFNYLLLKSKAIKFLYENNHIKESDFFGSWQDQQVPGSYSMYADQVMETLLMKVLPVIKEKTKLDLVPTCSYVRLYEKGSILQRHIDRPSCEISTTLNLGGDVWPFYLEPSGKLGKKGIKINLKPGDMLIYSGCELEHWREKFEGELCGQVFLHYNNKSGPFADHNLYDKRVYLGLPARFKRYQGKNDTR